MSNIDFIKKIYPPEYSEYNDSVDGYDEQCDYQPMLENMGGEILITEDDDDCQGDSYILYYNKSNSKYGVLIFGWGSCSGCDALQACESYQELLDLYEDLKRKIQWFENKRQAIDYLNSEDRKYECQWSDSKYKEFTKNVINLLQARECKKIEEK